MTQDGTVVTLHGVTRDGTDFLCAEGTGIFDGPTGQASIDALLAWHINAVRIPLNEACWQGMPGISTNYSGAAYQSIISAYVKAITSRGIYAIIDLHKNAPGKKISIHNLDPMPDADHSSTFWSQVATMFQHNGMVIFDLFNEPNYVSWPCWRDGIDCTGVPYTVVGMQTLVQTVRATGATNVLMLSGIGWADDLSGWLAYEPLDPLHNLVASWHHYMTSPCSTVACYGPVIGAVIAQVPLIVGEFGTDHLGVACDLSLIDDMNSMLDWLDQHGASYVAFSWNVGNQACGSQSLISSYSGKPHAPNGTAYQAHLVALASKAP